MIDLLSELLAGHRSGIAVSSGGTVASAVSARAMVWRVTLLAVAIWTGLKIRVSAARSHPWPSRLSLWKANRPAALEPFNISASALTLEPN